MKRENNMNKKVIGIVISIVVIIAIIGIVIYFNTRENEKIEINIEELATKIVESDAFEDDLEEVSDEVTMEAYGFSTEEIQEIVSYQGSGATSEELVILQVKEKNNLNSVKEKINTRLEERKEAFESYLPEEVFKIENRVLEVRGNYVILGIAKDANKVVEVVEEYSKDRG